MVQFMGGSGQQREMVVARPANQPAAKMATREIGELQIRPQFVLVPLADPAKTLKVGSRKYGRTFSTLGRREGDFGLQRRGESAKLPDSLSTQSGGWSGRACVGAASDCAAGIWIDSAPLAGLSETLVDVT
jgi:hypothetical protein